MSRAWNRAWNPRYVAYARAHGHTPEGMLAHDTEAWPGGKMAGFILWISQQWHAWYALPAQKGRKRHNDVLGDDDYASFDAMLGGAS